MSAIHAPTSGSTAHIYSIDVLRFIAALGVVLVHWCYGPPHTILTIGAAKYGFFGVHLFFMISGFVILLSAQGQDFRGFIVARLVRLYPGVKRGGLEVLPACLLISGFFLVMLAVAKDWVVVPPSKVVAALGAISYPLYLLHHRISIEMAWTTDSAILLASALLWIIALSYVVHRWGELPLQRWMRKTLSLAPKTASPSLQAPGQARGHAPPA